MCRTVVNVNVPICCGTDRSASTTKPYWQGRVCGTLLVRQVHKLNLGPCKTVALCATGLRPGLASTLKLKTVDITSLNPHEKLGGSNAARPSLHSHRYAVQRYHGLISPTAEASKPPAANVSRREANVGSLWGNGGLPPTRFAGAPSNRQSPVAGHVPRWGILGLIGGVLACVFFDCRRGDGAEMERRSVLFR